MRKFTDREYLDMLAELKSPLPGIEEFCKNHSMSRIEAAYLALTVFSDALTIAPPSTYFAAYNPTAENFLLDNVFALYLESWLAADANQAQTIDSFSTELERFKNKEIDSPYISKPKRYKHEAVQTNAYQQESFQRFAYKYLDMYECLKRQEGKNFLQDTTPYHRQSPTNSEHGWRWFSPMQLCFMHHLNNGDLQLWEMLVYRKVPLTASNNRSDFSALKNAYDSFDRMIHTQQQNANSKEYTIFCLMLRGLESSHCFHLMALIAKEMKRLGISAKEPLPELFNLFWGRYDLSNYNINISELYIFDPAWEERLIPQLFSADKTFIANQTNIALERRYHYTCLLNTMWLHLPPQLLGNWTEDDFDLAAKFFREDYTFIKDYSPVDLGESVNGNKSGYASVFHLYNQLMSYPENTTYRAYMQKENRKRSPGKKSVPSQTETES